MGHRSLRLLIEHTAKKLGDDIQFTYARASDFNVLMDKRYPFISLDPITASASYTENSFNYTKTWTCSMAFYEIDNMASTQDEYAILLDSSDVLVDSFIQKLNFFTDTYEGDGEIVITNISQTPFIKATSDILTGFLLTFQVLVPDDWNYCADGC